MKNTEWFGDTKCDICHDEIHEYLFDAATKYQGHPWATMCKKCFLKHSIQKLGVGFGQAYCEEKNGKFVKING